MDEKKDILTPEFESEENVVSDTDTAIDENTTIDELENNGSFSDELLETGALEELESDQLEVQPVKTKKRLLQIPIIISLAIVLVAAVGLFVFKAFFNTSIVGTWVYTEQTASADEAVEGENTSALERYYIFNKDGTMEMVIGTIRQKCTYEISYNEEGVMSLFMYLEGANTFTYECEISGNMFSGRKLVLKDSYYQQTMELKSGKYKEPEIEHDKDFVANEELLGKWVYDDGYYTFTFEFNEDGSAKYTEYGIVTATGYYTYTDNTFTFNYYANEPAQMERGYEIVNGDLIVDGVMQFVKETDSTPDEG